MTGGGFIPTRRDEDEYELEGVGNVLESGHAGHLVQWVGTPSVQGPKWARMSLLTIGMLGIQCVWSIEMGYASPFLLELGLSKDKMALVFMAGPLSGLIVQPLIGVMADKSKSKYGRRRPFMISGCFICAFAILLLGWSETVSSVFGGSKGFSIFLAVFAIYLIDFSINAVMSADRALVVDTLSSDKQEEGSAYGGRMFACGSVAGFFVGNLDLLPVFPWLGNTQLQILSFITASILLITHGFTSWAVTERVLLRDDRPQPRTGLLHTLKSIWENIFTLPPGIRTVCVVQFFSFLGWFPILFYTTIWVSRIYKNNHPELDPLDPQTDTDGVRAGARALFFQAIINIICSFALPPLIAESGVQPDEAVYAHLNGNGETYPDPPRSALWKRAQEEIASGGLVQRSIGWAKELSIKAREGKLVPIKGLTVIKVWWISQFVFAACMLATWFVTTVGGAYFVIALTGFSWALTQWAPYALLGELILIEGEQDRHDSLQAEAETFFDAQQAVDEDLETRRRDSNETAVSRRPPPEFPQKSRLRLDTRFDSPEPSPLVPASSRLESDGNETSLVLHHSDEEDEDDDRARSSASYRADSPNAAMRRPTALKGKGKDTADKAGVILGIHNVFLVLPQFVVTFMSWAIFKIMDPAPLPPNVEADMGPGSVDTITRREGMVSGGSSDSVGLIFRIGGISALIGGIICMRLARSWKRGEGI